jgi:hypothetical protein
MQSDLLTALEKAKTEGAKWISYTLDYVIRPNGDGHFAGRALDGKQWELLAYGTDDSDRKLQDVLREAQELAAKQEALPL